MRAALILVILLISALAWGQDLTYDVFGYGSKHVIVQISGTIPLGMTSSMSADGLSARISGVGVNFSPKNSNKARPSLVSSIQQVKRGQTADLIINLVAPGELSVTPGTSDLRIFIKLRKDALLPESKMSGTPLSTSAPHVWPLRILSADKLTKQDGLTLVFPEYTGLMPTSGLSAELRSLAYGLDILWGTLSGKALEYEKGASPQAQTPTDTHESEMDSLIQDLTKELVELRAQIEGQNQEIATLKGQPTS